MELFLSLWQYLGEGFGVFLFVACAAILLFLAIRRFHSRRVNTASGVKTAWEDRTVAARLVSPYLLL